MKAVILAGGAGTRLSEETQVIPKPLVKIGGKPILWHILKIYTNFGIQEFIICCGYKGYLIKDYFVNYFIQNSDFTIDLNKNNIEIKCSDVEQWKITLIDTGELTMTGGRLKRVQDIIGEERFCLTYGDGLSNIAIDKLIGFHEKQKTLATLTAVQLPGRFGIFDIVDAKVLNFQEKPSQGNWINGGFFVLEPEVFNYIAGDATIFEREPLSNLANEGQLAAFQHTGFWHPMDTLKDKNELENLWNSGQAPWRLWG